MEDSQDPVYDQGYDADDERESEEAEIDGGEVAASQSRFQLY